MSRSFASCLRIAAVFAAGLALAVVVTAMARPAPLTPASLSSFFPDIDWWAALALPWLGLAVEAVLVGWPRSALRRLIVGRSASARSDLAHQALFLSGGLDALVRLFTLGTIAQVSSLTDGGIGLLPLDALPLAAALPAIWLAAGFVTYWEHRFLHSRWIWPLHKAHHSPTEFTLLNSFRVHPLQVALSGITNTLPLVLLGFAPEHIALFLAVTLAAPLYLHSHWTGTAWLERFGINTPAGHRLHHGVAEEHHDCNFGDLTNIWDKVFGTYLAPGADIDQVTIGVEALEGRHNTSNPFREIALQTVDWLQTLRAEVANLLPRPYHQSPGAPREVRKPTGGAAAAGRERVTSGATP